MSEPPAAPSSDPPGPGEPWTVLRLVLWSAAYLKERGVEQGRLDAEHLLAEALGTTRLQLYLQFDRPLEPAELAAFKPLLLRRAGREPLQYILGSTPFRSLDLLTDSRVLIPRPETETLVEEVLAWVAEREPPVRTALDLGTGTGAIALSLAREGPFERVVATDDSEDALEVARTNRERAGLEDRVELRRGSLFESLRPGERFDVVVSNPPYVPEVDRPTLEPEVARWEPARALFAGPDGRALLDALADGAAPWVAPGGLLALEVGLGQAEGVCRRLEGRGEWQAPRIRRDLRGRPRFVLAVRAGEAGRPGPVPADRSTRRDDSQEG